MAALCKYWAFAFILCQLGQQHMLLNSIGSMGSFFLLGLGALLLLINSGRVFDRKTVSSSPFIYSFVFIFILYQFTFGIFDLNEKTGIYLIAKVVCCLMIALSVQKDLSFYLQRLMPILAAVTSLLILLGFVHNNVIFEGRHTLGFCNANGLGAISSLCAGAMILDSSDRSKKKIAIILLCVLATFLSGSRASIGILCLTFVIKYGLNVKFLAVLLAGVLAWQIILPMAGISSTGLNRFTESVENMDFSSSREGERKATLIMIAESPILGNGFDVEQSEKAKAVSGLGPHNGYLDIMKMIGIPYSIFLFAFMAYYTCSVWRKFHKSACDYDRIHLFVIISVLIAANFESYLWGINQVVTTLLFTSFAVLQKRMTALKHGI